MSETISSEELQAFFFRAMINGWANNPPKVTLPGLPGFKAIIFEEGPLKLVDAYSKTPGSIRSGGMTIIYHDTVPVWMMQYSGGYEKDAIPFLKEALLAAYQAGQFNGGRGPNHFSTERRFTYYNTTESSPFEKFRGREHVLDMNYADPVRGYHVYQGGLL